MIRESDLEQLRREARKCGYDIERESGDKTLTRLIVRRRDDAGSRPALFKFDPYHARFAELSRAFWLGFAREMR